MIGGAKEDVGAAVVLLGRTFELSSQLRQTRKRFVADQGHQNIGVLGLGFGAGEGSEEGDTLDLGPTARSADELEHGLQQNLSNGRRVHWRRGRHGGMMKQQWEHGMGILQLRIELSDVAPLIWRRLQIPDSYSFWDLHVAIQSAFGWNDTHLHEFAVPCRGGVSPLLRIGIPLADDAFRTSEETLLPGWEQRVAENLAVGQTGVTYLYDFGDHWEHRVLLEEALDSSPGRRYPRCVAGERAGPPDDCGGAHGYASLLEVLADPQAEGHAEMKSWASRAKGLSGAFDPEAFDEQQIKFENPATRLRRMLRDIG